MTVQQMDSALLQAVEDLALTDPDGDLLPIAWPNEDFDPPADFSDWIGVFQLPAATSSASTGVGGWDRHQGILQIDFNSKPGTGTATLLGYCQLALDEFVAGQEYTLAGEVVRIEQASRTPIREIDGWARVSVSISWFAHTVRPAI